MYTHFWKENFARLKYAILFLLSDAKVVGCFAKPYFILPHHTVNMYIYVYIYIYISICMFLFDFPDRIPYSSIHATEIGEHAINLPTCLSTFQPSKTVLALREGLFLGQ